MVSNKTIALVLTFLVTLSTLAIILILSSVASLNVDTSTLKSHISYGAILIMVSGLFHNRILRMLNKES